MVRVGRKIERKLMKVGSKFMHARGRIGRKLAKVGRIAGRIAPFLSAVPGIGPELALAATGASAISRGVGNALQAKGAGGAARSLAETYHAARRSQRKPA